MIDLRGHQKLEWPNELRPRGEGTWEKETFDLWWDRNKTLIAHIHPVVAEQWIYRHWSNSPYCHLYLDRILGDRRHGQPNGFSLKSFDPIPPMTSTSTMIGHFTATGTWNPP
jgi:hypothetical protein